jgi:glycine cleavage system H protein
MVPILVLFTIIVFLTADYFHQRAAGRRVAMGVESAVAARAAELLPAAVEPSSSLEEIPAGVFVAPSHVWTQVEPSGSVRVGVDRLLLSLLGGLDAVYGHPQGFDVKQGGPLVMLRNGQRALKIRSPLEGTVSEVNPATREEPGKAYTDPFEDGWIYRIQPARLSVDLKKMRVAEEARGWMRKELHRLRDLFVTASTPGDLAPAALVDGGLLAEDAATQLGDREWEDLVAGFFDKSAFDASPSHVRREIN